MSKITKYELTSYAKGLLKNSPEKPVILGFGGNTINLRDYPEDKLDILYHKGSAIVQIVEEEKQPQKPKLTKKTPPKNED